MRSCGWAYAQEHAPVRSGECAPPSSEAQPIHGPKKFGDRCFSGFLVIMVDPTTNCPFILEEYCTVFDFERARPFSKYENLKQSEVRPGDRLTIEHSTEIIF